MNKDAEAYKVFTTMDYDKFKLIEGNRDILDSRCNKIRESAREIGWIRNPILVNQYFQIIDGQARFVVRKEAGLPIEYIMDSNTGITECKALNLWSTAWNKQNYIASEIAMHNENYIRLDEVCRQFPNLTLNTITGTIDNVVVAGGRGDKLSKGLLIFTEERQKEIEPALAFVSKNADAIKNVGGQTRILFTVLTWVLNNTAADKAWLEKVLRTKYPLMPPYSNAVTALKGLEAIYNPELNARKKIYFENEYQRWKDGVATTNNHVKSRARTKSVPA